MRLTPRWLAAAGGAALLLGGCGTKTVNTDQLEEQLVQSFGKQRDVDPAKLKVDCPDDEEADQGHRFECTFTAPDGSTAKVIVTLTNDEGGYSATIPADQFS